MEFEESPVSPGFFAFAMAYSAARLFRRAKDAVGMVVFSEPTDPIRLLCLVLIVAGMVGLKLNSPI